MTAASLLRTERGANGLRRIAPRQDMTAVADLIEMVFAQQMDSAGRRMLREMRTLGRAGPLGALLGRFFLPPAATTPMGYVWEQDGRIVGNAGLLPIPGHPRHWILANVAVHPRQRGRGIGRALTAACLELAYEKAAAAVRLQVDKDNQQAQVLYASLGFRPVTTRTTWHGGLCLCMPDTPALTLARPREMGEWRQQLALADEVHPEGLLWPFPSNQGMFRESRLSRWFGLSSTRHWVWKEDGRLLGSLSARHQMEEWRWNLVLVVQPEARGRIEGPLLAAAAQDLGAQGARIVFDYPSGPADALLTAWGYKAKRTLTWMIHSEESHGG